ncbi:hypothetical protein [Ruegeria arenilitoris]|uniref:hypothetical protein n=1 Tax=Ruegeria arenilitoris TaxID=1173585 RepID=UPI00147D11E2|nr:hypothetical protein [Ruegeria arenilitoris]
MKPLSARSEALWVAAGHFSLLTGGLALVRVQTGLLEPSVYAHLALALTVFSFGQVAGFGGLNQAITRLYALAEQRRALAAYRSCVCKKYLQAAGACSAVLCVLAFVSALTGAATTALLVLSVLPYSLLNGALSALIAMGNAARCRPVGSGPGPISCCDT